MESPWEYLRDHPLKFYTAVKKYLEEKGIDQQKASYAEKGTWGRIQLRAVRKAVFYEILLPELTRLAYRYNQLFRYAWMGVRSINLMDPNDFGNVTLFFGNLYPGDPEIFEITEVVREEDLR